MKTITEPSIEKIANKIYSDLKMAIFQGLARSNSQVLSMIEEESIKTVKLRLPVGEVKIHVNPSLKTGEIMILGDTGEPVIIKNLK